MNNIELLRRQKGLSTKELADMVGVSASAVSQWESGVKNPRKDRLEKLAVALETSIDFLVDKKENPVQEVDRIDQQILNIVKELTPSQKNNVLSFIAGLRASQEE